jgi:hypothetical protein
MQPFYPQSLIRCPFTFSLQAKVRLQAKPPTKPQSQTTTPSAPPANTTEPTAPTSYANVVASSEPAHESGAHFVSEKDLEANAQEAAGAQTPLQATETVAGKQVRQTSAIGVLRDTYRTKGFAGWYQGMHAQIIKAVLSQGELHSRRQGWFIVANLREI